jgi:GTP cyclohydrolase I
MSKPVDTIRIEEAVREILLAIGENPEREGLVQTPARVARFWAEFMNQEAEHTLTTFETVQADQMIVVSGITVWSLCEHHLLPFRCRMAVGYICKDRIVGLSKIPRLCRAVASGLQIQERVVTQVAHGLKLACETEDVGVVASGEHLCTMMRGARSDCTMTSSALLGAFRLPEVRAEFLSLAKLGG